MPNLIQHDKNKIIQRQNQQATDNDAYSASESICSNTEQELLNLYQESQHLKDKIEYKRSLDRFKQVRQEIFQKNAKKLYISNDGRTKNLKESKNQSNQKLFQMFCDRQVGKSQRMRNLSKAKQKNKELSQRNNQKDIIKLPKVNQNRQTFFIPQSKEQLTERKKYPPMKFGKKNFASLSCYL